MKILFGLLLWAVGGFCPISSCGAACYVAGSGKCLSVTAEVLSEPVSEECWRDL